MFHELKCFVGRKGTLGEYILLQTSFYYYYYSIINRDSDSLVLEDTLQSANTYLRFLSFLPFALY